jgi:photosystem II stability/assembly factor-like uncharacterized protein
MSVSHHFLRTAALCAALLGFSAILPAAHAQQVPPETYSNLKWRLIGPYRAGRITSVTGSSENTSTYYAGTPGGGVWRTFNSGQTWEPIFDDARVAPIGAVAAAWSNPHILYVGTGENGGGNGLWKSTDAGKTWKNVGLQETHAISTVLIDPKNPDNVLVGALGDGTSGENRGVFKSTDGGATWRKVLFKDAQSGAIDVSYASDSPQIVFAAFQNRGGGGRGQAGQAANPTAEIYKSTDGGDTWQPLSATGLPVSGLGRIGIVAANGSGGKRVYAILNQGFFRSDDSGATWTRTTNDARVVSTGYFGKVFVNPKNPDDVFIGQTSMYRSTDGGHNWVAFSGAPSGDDYHVIWINPENPRFMIQGIDQGAVVSEDGGSTWSSWYNQPTGQLYHVITDNQFPYIVYGSQQDSGTVAIPSRSDFGVIGDNERFSIAGFEFSFMAPDPLNPNLVYSGNWYNSVIRFDRNSSQFVTVWVNSDRYRNAQMSPLGFAPWDPKTLYLGTQYLLKTSDGGMTWKEISPDLTEVPNANPTQANSPQSGGSGNVPPQSELLEDGASPQQARPRGALNTVAFSPARAGVIWTGSTNGRIQLTTDGGKHWADVTPAEIKGPASIGMIEAGHFDAASAYAAIAQGRSPIILRTRDSGKTWQKIVEGLPVEGSTAGFARFVREDTVRKGMLFAGTETAMWVSFDDGDHWQSLQLNLPVTSMRDMVIHGNDLVVGTYGRSIYILDDIVPLREARASSSAGDPLTFYPPSPAVRWRWDDNADTPLPREVPAAKNPPDGAILDYFVGQQGGADAKIEITDSRGNLVRTYNSTAPEKSSLLPNVPEYWFAPPAVVDASHGPHRFVWDLRYQEPRILPYSYYGNFLDYIEYTLADHAIPGETPRNQAPGPLVAPGTYTVTLTVKFSNGSISTQKQQLNVTEDPRVHVTQRDLEDQLALAQRAIRGLDVTTDAFNAARPLRDAVIEREKSAAGAQNAADLVEALKKLDGDLAAMFDGTRTAPGIGPENRDLERTFTMIESGDSRPSESARNVVSETCSNIEKSFADWSKLQSDSLPKINALLTAHQLAPLPTVHIAADSSCGK